MPRVKLSISQERKLGLALGYIQIIVSNLVALFLIPFITRSLGADGFGLYQLVGAFTGYITLLDFGMSNTTIRFIAKYRAEQNQQEEENFLAHSYIIYGVLSCASLLVGMTFYVLLPRLYANTLSLQQIRDARLMLAILVVNIALSFLGNPFVGIIRAYERFSVLSALAFVKIVLRAIVVVVVLSAGYQAVSIVIVDTLFNIMYFGICGFTALSVLRARIKLHKFDTHFISQIFNFSFFVFLNAIVNQIFWRMDQTIIGMYVEVTFVAIYAIGMQIVMYYQIFANNLGTIILPQMTQMEASGADPAAFTDISIKGGRFQLLLLGLILGGFVVFGKDFIYLWVGKHYADAYIIALITMIPLTLPLIQIVLVSIINAKGRHQFRAKIYLVTALLNIPITIYFVRHFGYLFAAVSTALSFIFAHGIVMNLFYHFRIGINIPRFFRETFRGILPGIALSIVLGLLLVTISDIQNWLQLAIQVILYTAMYGAIQWIWGLTTNEKGLFKGILNGIGLQIKALGHRVHVG